MNYTHLQSYCHCTLYQIYAPPSTRKDMKGVLARQEAFFIAAKDAVYELSPRGGERSMQTRVFVPDFPNSEGNESERLVTALVGHISMPPIRIKP